VLIVTSDCFVDEDGKVLDVWFYIKSGFKGLFQRGIEGKYNWKLK
jgi:hypothetical protein